MTQLQSGDRVAYAAKFLKNIGAFTGETPRRRGTFVKMQDMGKGVPPYARVKWDNFEAISAKLADQYGNDYVTDAREHGQLVHANNIAKVGSARFALNDL